MRDYYGPWHRQAPYLGSLRETPAPLSCNLTRCPPLFCPHRSIQQEAYLVFHVLSWSLLRLVTHQPALRSWPRKRRLRWHPDAGGWASSDSVSLLFPVPETDRHRHLEPEGLGYRRVLDHRVAQVLKGKPAVGDQIKANLRPDG